MGGRGADRRRSTGRPARAGPAAVDLGHLRWNLALDYGQRVADAVLPHPEHHPYYDVVTALDVLPELDASFTHAELLRLEEHVAARSTRVSDQR